MSVHVQCTHVLVSEMSSTCTIHGLVMVPQNHTLESLEAPSSTVNLNPKGSILTALLRKANTFQYPAGGRSIQPQHSAAVCSTSPDRSEAGREKERGREGRGWERGGERLEGGCSFMTKTAKLQYFKAKKKNKVILYLYTSLRYRPIRLKEFDNSSSLSPYAYTENAKCDDTWELHWKNAHP